MFKYYAIDIDTFQVVATSDENLVRQLLSRPDYFVINTKDNVVTYPDGKTSNVFQMIGDEIEEVQVRSVG